jgi:predicted enzyme related to lactoylglutathione lyase
MSGRVVHFDIPYDDAERARSFYAEIFGWQLMPLPGMGYTLVTTGPTDEQGPTEPGFVNGGMRQREDELTTPDIVIHVDDIEETLQAVKRSGGSTVTGRQPVGDMGFTAYIKDTEGNLVGLLETLPR